MAMSTVLQAVTDDEIEALRREPERVNSLDTEWSYSTHFAASINYFVTGNAYPIEAEHPLWPMLHGEESVACPSLENGEFGIVAPDTAHRVAELLAALDLASVTARIEEADLEDLVEEEELYDLEVIDHDEAPATITGDLRGLVAFYSRVSVEKRGVIGYTT
jgi:hypothetical protein